MGCRAERFELGPALQQAIVYYKLYITSNSFQHTSAIFFSTKHALQVSLICFVRKIDAHLREFKLQRPRSFGCRPLEGTVQRDGSGLN
jgi:hypothetical protein